MTTALVTGAGNRLGRAMALELAGLGFDVAVHYANSRNKAEGVVQEIVDMGQRAVAVRADLLIETEVEALLPKVVEALGGPVTCLINNASIVEYDDLQMASRESWDRHMESNLRAPFVLTQAMAAQVPEPETCERGEPVAQGLVINMVDQNGRALTPDFMTYTLAKMGLWAFTKTAAQGLAPRVRVNAIGSSPALKGHSQNPRNFRKQSQSTVPNRGANAEDIVATLAYFLNAPAVTGQLVCVDGGTHPEWQTPDALGGE